MACMVRRYQSDHEQSSRTVVLRAVVKVHEIAHLRKPNHSDRLAAILDEHYPTCREARVELNELPISAETLKK